MKRSIKASIGFIISAIAAVALVCILVPLLSCQISTGTIQGNPENKIEIEDKADGFTPVDWDLWKEVNPDVIGWVTVQGTTIDYPIVQAPADDPDYYLTHDIYKNWNYMGCPYLDAECAESGLDSKNSVVFAHNMRFGEGMFEPFANYTDPVFADGHRVVQVQTPEWKREYKMEAASVVKGSDTTKRTQFVNTDDFKQWYDERLAEAKVKRTNGYSSRSFEKMRLITFCTCSYSIWPDNERTLVYTVYNLNHTE